MLGVLLPLLLAAGAAPPPPPPPQLPSNPELTGVNNEWVDPLGLLVSVNRDSQGRAGGWLPPRVNAWVNRSDPLNSASLNELLAGLQLGSYRYPGVRRASVLPPRPHHHHPPLLPGG
eukprot:SAG11_NODE_8442_length_1015_cov_1.399563_2_plen_117_part_00